MSNSTVFFCLWSSLGLLNTFTSYFRKWNRQVRSSANCDPIRSRRFIGWHNWRGEETRMEQQPLCIHVGMLIAWKTSMWMLTYMFLPFIFTFCTLNIHFRRELVIYLNSFSGDATTEFPSTLEMARGGVCWYYASFTFWNILFVRGICALST